MFGHTLTASVAFPVLNFLNILRNPLVQFPDVLNWVMVEGKVAAERISQFLCEGSAVQYVERGTVRGVAVDAEGKWRLSLPSQQASSTPVNVSATMSGAERAKQ